MKQTIFSKSRTVRKLFKRVPLRDPSNYVHGFTSEPDGSEEVYYSTTIDLEALDSMGRRAAHNKSGVCTDGALIVKVVSRKKIS